MEELKKYCVGRKLVTITCDCCGKEFQKPESEYKRNVRLGRHNFCSRSCSAKVNNKNRVGKPISDKQREHLLSICDNQKDEYSPFRYTLRNIKKRFKEVNIDLEYLKELWEKQEGKCPYTGLSLILPIYKNLKEIPFIYRASLDRIDSSKGYVKGNVQFVSTPINLMKSEMSDLDTKKFLKLISSYTSSFDEEWTISSPSNEGSDAQAGN